MLQARAGSNSIIDFVFGHCSSSFCLWSKSFMVFFYVLFVAIFLWKTRRPDLFFFESQGNFFSPHNIRPEGLRHMAYYYIPIIIYSIWRLSISDKTKSLISWSRIYFLVAFCVGQFLDFIINWSKKQLSALLRQSQPKFELFINL